LYFGEQNPLTYFEMPDVLIVGGGPAGSVTAICLARAGIRVAIMEAQGRDRDRFGETVPPEINPVLGELGLWEAFQALRPVAAPGIVCRWGTRVAAEQDFVSNPHGSGWRVDRDAFDAMLLREAASAGAHVYTGCKPGARERSDGVWKLDEIRARFLVDAAGRNGLNLGVRGHGDIEDVLLAIAIRISYSGGAPSDCRTYVETTPAGWWYSGLLPDGDVMAMFFTDPEIYRTEGVAIADQLAAAPLTRERLQGGQIARSHVVYVPSSCRSTMCGDGWLAVGDSASCYDPLSGRGIFKALRQGAAAAASIAKAFDGDTAAIPNYAADVRQEFESYARQRRTYYAGERRWEASGFWRRRRTAGRSEP
jgi:flavin-dependent dehydrogenase